MAANDKANGASATTATGPMQSPAAGPAGDAQPPTEPQSSVSKRKRKRKRESEKANRLAAKLETVALAIGDGDDSKDSEPPTKKRQQTNGRAAEARPPKQTKKSIEMPKAPAKPEKLNETVARMDPMLVADYIGQKLRKFEKELSAVELEDRFIPSSAFLDTTSYAGERTLADLADYLEKSGAPSTAALRVCWTDVVSSSCRTDARQGIERGF